MSDQPSAPTPGEADAAANLASAAPDPAKTPPMPLPAPVTPAPSAPFTPDVTPAVPVRAPAVSAPIAPAPTAALPQPPVAPKPVAPAPAAVAPKPPPTEPVAARPAPIPPPSAPSPAPLSTPVEPAADLPVEAPAAVEAAAPTAVAAPPAVAEPAPPATPAAVVGEEAPAPSLLPLELAPAAVAHAVVDSVVDSVVAPSSELLDAARLLAGAPDDGPAPLPIPAAAPMRAPGAVSEDEFRRLFEQIRDAVDARAAEVEKGRRQRSFFSGLLFLVMAAMALGFWTLVAGFDRGVFANALKDGLVDRAPALFDSARTVAKEIVPVYEAEIERTMPDFSRALADAFAREASVLGERLSPVLARAAGDKAVGELAAALKAAFPDDVKDDATARKLALAIRAAQARAKVDGPDAPEASYVLVGQIQDALQTLGPPEQGALAEGRIADGIRDAALDVLKAKLSSGEGLGIDAMIRQRLGTEPAPADLEPAPTPAKGGK